VISVASRSRPQLIESFGQRIAEIGRMSYLGALVYADDARADGIGVLGGESGQVAPDASRSTGIQSALPRPSRSPARQYNSAQRLRALWHELTVPDPLRTAVAQLGAPVLLVDDRIETGWTMTVAARLLREAGAPAVLPLALAVTAG
jgi:ATP-dependent DNA helicase RecQ